MKFVRATAAILAGIIGLLALAGGMFVAAGAFYADFGHTQDWGPVIGGVVAMLVGLGFFWLARVVGGEAGPVQSYRSRPRKRRSPSP